MIKYTYVKAEVNIDAHFEQKFKDILGDLEGSLEYMSEIYQSGKYAHFFILGVLYNYNGSVIEWFKGKIDALKQAAKEEKYGYDPVLRALICVENDIRCNPYNQLRVWQLDQTYSEEWLHDQS